MDRNNLDAIFFLTTIIQASVIDVINGSKVLKDKILILYTEHGSNYSIPG